MTVEYNIDYSAIEELEKKFEQIPGKVESMINSYLHKDGAKVTIRDITGLIRLSKPSKGAEENRPHAKHSKWSKVEKINLGFVVKARGGAANKPGSFGYLVFPNEGRGPRNPLEQRFMERGLHQSVDELISNLSNLAEEEIRKGLS